MHIVSFLRCMTVGECPLTIQPHSSVLGSGSPPESSTVLRPIKCTHAPRFTPRRLLCCYGKAFLRLVIGYDPAYGSLRWTAFRPAPTRPCVLPPQAAVFGRKAEGFVGLFPRTKGPEVPYLRRLRLNPFVYEGQAGSLCTPLICGSKSAKLTNPAARVGRV